MVQKINCWKKSFLILFNSLKPYYITVKYSQNLLNQSRDGTYKIRKELHSLTLHKDRYLSKYYLRVNLSSSAPDHSFQVASFFDNIISFSLATTYKRWIANQRTLQKSTSRNERAHMYSISNRMLDKTILIILCLFYLSITQKHPVESSINFRHGKQDNYF